MLSKLFFRKSILVATLVVFGLMVGCAQKPEPADLVLKNGRIVTVDDKLPEARAVAIKEGRFIAVGSDEKMAEYIGDSTQVIDLEGHLAVPGLIEAHGHFTSLGQAKLRLDLMKVRNWDEIISMVKDSVAKSQPGEWILGRGWHQEKWDSVPEPNVDGLPYHDELSRVSPDNPVLLNHASGHSSFANAKAMELAGITTDTPDPDGGEIVRDSLGTAVGVFRETAQGLLSQAMYSAVDAREPSQMEEERRKVVELAVQECLENGITAFHDAGTGFSTIDLYKELADQGKLGIRMYAMLSAGNDSLEKRIADYRIEGYADHHLTVRSIKRLIDGALGAHGAWLLEPYTDLPSSVGLNTMPVDELIETARIAVENDFQLCVHAIGDRANREVLDIYQAAFESHKDKKDTRWRVEHAQHLHPQDIPRFAELGVIPSMQGIHCISDGPWIHKRLGEKRAEEGAYVWRKLMDTGAVICNGTDVPVEAINPMACYYGTVTRMTSTGEFYPDQKMTREEALRSYTLNAAYAAFQENVQGSITTGKLGDVTVLSKDILTIPADEILTTEALYTIVGGKVLYKK